MAPSPSTKKARTLAADPALAELVAGGGRPMIDLDEALLTTVRADAASVNADAVVAEVEALRLEQRVDEDPGDDMARQDLAKVRKVAADRRRRADGLMKRAGVTSRHELAIDMRLWAAQQLEAAQHDQVRFEERLAHPDLYAVSEDELNLQRHPDTPPPLTLGKIKEDAATGRARIAALTTWLAEHLDADGPRPDEDAAGVNPQRDTAIASLRRFTGDAPVKTEADPAGDLAGAVDDPRELEGRRPTENAGLGPTDERRTDLPGEA